MRLHYNLIPKIAMMVAAAAPAAAALNMRQVQLLDDEQNEKAAEIGFNQHRVWWFSSFSDTGTVNCECSTALMAKQTDSSSTGPENGFSTAEGLSCKFQLVFIALCSYCSSWYLAYNLLPSNLAALQRGVMWFATQFGSGHGAAGYRYRCTQRDSIK